ncbi:MAG: lytic transglycosylase domain-containing protein [Acidobacteriaceae bacterium]|nr:lytic transglycosylase domain-containing protein [Acidobacteriaceae bacterium]
MRALAYLVLATGIVFVRPSAGKEAVYLTTGFSLEADSHTQQDERVVLLMGTGTLELPAAQVARIEVLPDAVTPPPAKASNSAAQPPELILEKAAYLQGLDQDFVRSVAQVESGLRQNAVSRKGAVGLMQLMPGTAANLGVHADQPFDNATGGAKYLRELLIRYQGNSVLALAAYNAGPGAVAKFGGVPPYAETQRYIVLVLREYQRALKARTKTQALTAHLANTPSATN